MIGHVDADCFYASAERVRYPHLIGVPVAVLGNQGACCIAKSYEAKKAGITTGMPIWEAVPKCPSMVFVKRDFAWYEVLSRKMLALVHEISPQVEFYSIDEQFFYLPKATTDDAKSLQQRILANVGVPVSIGIAPTKTLAKIISDANKPFGYGVVRSMAECDQLLVGRPVEEITGIAKRSAKKLAAYSITTCDQFAAADRRLIRRLLTATGEALWWELNGTSVIPIQTTKAANTLVARGGSIGAASRDKQRVEAFVVRNIERLVEALAHHDQCCDYLMLSLQFTDGSERAGRCSMLGSRADFEALLEAAMYLLPTVWHPRTLIVHYMHVIAAGLRPLGNRQQSLFEQPKLTDIKHAINKKLGRFAVRSAATTPLADIYADGANNYDICDIYGKSCF